MTQTTTIDGTDRSSVIWRESCEWAESAYLGEISSGTIKIHDDAGSILVVGHKMIITQQSDCSTARLFTGFVGRKSKSRGQTYSVGAGREITVTTKDPNDLLTRYIITGTDGNRPSETITARVTWLLASNYVNSLFSDLGAVSTSSLVMDATDYRSQRAGDVLGACAKKAKFNYYIRWKAASSAFELVFRDDNASTADTAGISIANDGTANGTSIFAPFQDADFTEDPEDVYSGVDAGYARGRTYRTRAATATAFVARDGTTDDAGIKTLAAAQDEGDKFLFQSRSEEESLTVTLRMRSAYVNLILPGQRVSVAMSHLATEGYGTGAYWRVLRRRVRQPLNTDNDYDVTLDLSPQEPGCSGVTAFVQHRYQTDEDATGISSTVFQWTGLSAPATAGNLLVMGFATSVVSGTTVDATPTGWTWAGTHNRITNAGGGAHYCNTFWKKSTGGDETVQVQMANINGDMRIEMAEYSGLTNPSVFDGPNYYDNDGTLGFCPLPSTDYPNGPSITIGLGFLDDGPTGGDSLTVVGGMNLRSSITGGLHGSFEVGLSDRLADTSGTIGTTIQYPTASYWAFGFTGTQDVTGIGITFVGDNC